MKKIMILLFSVISFFSYSQDIKMVLQAGKSINFEKLYFSDDEEVIAGVDNIKVVFFDKYGTIISSYVDGDNNAPSAAITISSDNKYAIIPVSVYNVIYEINSGKFTLVNKYAETYYRHTYAVKILDDKTYLAAFSSNILIPVLIDKNEFQNKILSKIKDSADRNTIKNIYKESPDDPDIMLLRSDIKYNFDFEEIINDTGYNTENEKYLTVDKFDLTGKFIKTLFVQKLTSEESCQGIILSKDNKKIILITSKNNLILVDQDYGKLADITITDNPLLNLNNIKFINNDKNICVTSLNNPVFSIYNLDGMNVQNIKTEGYFLGFDSLNSGIITFENRINSAKKINEMYFNYITFDGKKTKEIKVNILPNIYSIYSEKNKLIYTSLNKTLQIYSFVTDKSATVVMDTDDWLIFTNDGYWECSRNGGKFITMVKGLFTYGIDQMAVKYNRPDIVYKNLGSTETDRLNHYKTLYEKRLKKLGLTEKDLLKQSDPSEVTIDDYEMKGEKANIKFTIKQNSNNVVSYNIYVNDVPVYDTNGKQLTIKPDKNLFKLNEDVNLTPGDNKVEISSKDTSGLESYRASVRIRFNAGRVEGYKPSDLYFIGFGISRYKNESLNLEYADKDVKDLKNIFDKMNKNFNKVYSYTFTNDQVTKDTFIKAKKLIENAKENDTFVLFIAGHGLHEDTPEAKYYYILYDTDINKLSETAADFELIEDILQGIKPRNKLFLMDTCESGELDDAYVSGVTLTGKDKPVSRAIKRVKSETTQFNDGKKYYLYNTNRYIYNNLLRRTGTIVFSSCKGNEYSYESDKYQNGFFTEELINTLTKSEGDKITINNLKQSVINGVNSISLGLQNPTVDKDNIYVNFTFPIVH